MTFPPSVRNDGRDLRNGVLLRAAADAGFDVLITTDSSMRYQQNLKRIGIAIIVTVGVRNRFDELRSLMPRIIESLAIIRPGDAVEIKAHRTDSVCDRRLSLVL